MMHTPNLQLLAVERVHVEALVRSKSEVAALLQIRVPDGWPHFPDSLSALEAHASNLLEAAFPGVVDAIRTLHRQGHPLHTASGESSLDLDGYLQAIGVRDCFGRLYGPDLIETLKEGPEYYERMFADLGIAPANALVVDDSPRAIEWATQAGARAVLVGDSSFPRREMTLPIGSLVELPALLQQLDWFRS